MKKEEFIESLKEVLQRDDPISENDALAEYEEWDSLSKMAVIAFFDKNFGVKISLKEISQIKSVQDLIALAKIDQA